MRLGVEEIRNIRLNNPYEVTANYVVENADNAYSSMILLDMVEEVMAIYKDELSQGQEFLNLFVHHDFQKKEPVKPNIARRAENFSKALFKFVVNGMPIETKEEAKRKLAICEDGCEYFDGSICRHINCGCYSKIKTFFSTESCPIGKW